MADEITTPMPPSRLPEKEKALWKKKYIEAFRQAKADNPDNDSEQQQFARREANRMLKPPEPSSYAEAMALPEHQLAIMHDEKGKPGPARYEKEGQLKVVTSDGKKYSFDVPEKGKDKTLKPSQA